MNVLSAPKRSRAAAAATLVAAGITLLTARAFGQSAIDTAVRESVTPLVQVGIATRRGVCIAKTYGVEGEPPRMHAASISKLFTAMVIVKLQEEGKLSLGDSVGKHVREFGGSSITLAQLLTHTSGLRDKQRADERNTSTDVDKYFANLAKQKPDAKREWHYSDAGFNLLGRVIERTVGTPYSAAMQTRLLTPLGMTQSTFDISSIPAANRAIAHRREKPLPHPWDAAFLPSSGLQTTAGDLAKFVHAVLTVQTGGKVDFMITAKSLYEMTEPQVQTEWKDVTQGYGWQLSKTTLGVQWRHAGSEGGFESLLTIYPERGFGIVVMGNREDWPRFQLESKLRALMAQDAIQCEG